MITVMSPCACVVSLVYGYNDMLPSACLVSCEHVYSKYGTVGVFSVTVTVNKSPTVCLLSLTYTGDGTEHFSSAAYLRFSNKSSRASFGDVYRYTARVELLVSHRAPLQVEDRGMLTRYGGYRGNKIPGANQN